LSIIKISANSRRTVVTTFLQVHVQCLLFACFPSPRSISANASISIPTVRVIPCMICSALSSVFQVVSNRYHSRNQTRYYPLKVRATPLYCSQTFLLFDLGRDIDFDNSHFNKICVFLKHNPFKQNFLAIEAFYLFFYQSARVVKEPLASIMFRH
jgi:hypothetical protein